MGETVETRELHALDDLRAAAALFDRVWQDERVLTVELLRALTTHGNPVLGAYRGDELVGAQMGFLGRHNGELILHSHVTGVPRDLQHAGIGFVLKCAQRDWALANGIDTITWTFDPMIARNAYFNLRKLGARAERFFRGFYGVMEDAFNVGERTDRLEIVWRLGDPRVVSSAEGTPVPVDAADAEPLLDAEEEAPLPRPAASGKRVAIRVPREYLELRERDRELAGSWRDAVADLFEDALARGYVAVDFHPEGMYLLEHP